MNHQDALAFLQRPLPERLSPAQVARLGEVLYFLHEHPIEEAIQPMFECIQEWDDPSIGESIVSYLRHFEPEQFRPIVARMLTHDRQVVRMWAATAAMKWPDPGYLPALATHLDSGDEVIRMQAACAIESIGGEQAEALARLYLPLEKDPEIYDILRDLIERKYKK